MPLMPIPWIWKQQAKLIDFLQWRSSRIDKRDGSFGNNDVSNVSPNKQSRNHISLNAKYQDTLKTTRTQSPRNAAMQQIIPQHVATTAYSINTATFEFEPISSGRVALRLSCRVIYKLRKLGGKSNSENFPTTGWCLFSFWHGEQPKVVPASFSLAK